MSGSHPTYVDGLRNIGVVLDERQPSTLFNDPAFAHKRGLGSRKAFENARCESKETDKGGVTSVEADVQKGGCGYRNESASVAVAINGRSFSRDTDKTFTQKRHYVDVNDYKFADTPKKREGESRLQRLRNVLPKGKAQAHRVLVHVFRKHDLDYNGQVDCSAFKRGINSLGVGWTNKQVGAVLREIDGNKTGYVDYGALADRVVELSRTEAGGEKSTTRGNSRQRRGRRQDPAAKQRWETARARWGNRDEEAAGRGGGRGGVRVLRLAGGIGGASGR
eukprot:g2352.t1